MDKSKLIPHQATDSDTTPIKFWGTIALGAIGIVAIGFKLVAMFKLPGAGVVYFAIGLYALTIAAGIAVILLTLRGRQDLGAQLSIYMLGLVYAISPVIDQGQALTASLSLVTISGIVILQLLPKALRVRYVAITGATLILIWALEWINPSWRLQTEVATVGPASAIIFGLILAVILLRQAWGGNLRVKIITAFTVVALISLGILGTVTYFNYRSQVRQDMRQRMLNIVSLVAMKQDGNLHSTIQGPENAEDEAHINILAQNVDYLATDPDLKYIYTMRKNEQGQIYFVINARQGGELGDPIGTIYNEPSELLRTQFDTLNGPVVEEDIYTDIYGSVLPAYAPFYRSDGTREGIIGVDLDAAKVFAQDRRILSLILGTTVAAMFFVILSGLFLGNVFAKPLINLSYVAHEITEGNLGARAEVETADELGDLAKAFNIMTSKLQETLQGLEQRVADRTRNLELAAEVGRAVSQVRELDVMLKDACELILKEFDLYYVQVYLTSSNQKSLNLEAGTGEVGAQLVRREHSLPFDVNSINGRAAVEKHSLVISDTTQTATFRQNPLLPETRGEMAIPLIVADKVVGVLDMQSRERGVLNEEVLPAFEALAGQLAVAIQNAKLLEQTNEARAEVEKQARRLVRQSWGEYMDAIHTPEQIGFKFNQKEVIPLAGSNESRMSENAISSSISVTGESLGSLTVEMGVSPSQDQAVELVNSVAQQMARQIENLRLLESAERYRQKAELAMDRTTLERWRQYSERQQKRKMAYRYDTREVRPLEQESEVPALTLPIKDRDNTIGKFSIPGLEEQNWDSLEIVNAIVERLGSHIAVLSQYDQTQSALVQSEKLFTASQTLTRATDLQELLSGTVRTLDLPAVNRAILTTFAYDSEDEIEHLTVVANWWSGEGHEVTPLGTRYSQEMIQLLPMFVSPTPVFFDDTFSDERVDEKTRELVKRLNLRTVAVLPLHLSSRQIGALFLEGENPHNFTPDEIRLFISLAPQIATVVENRRQFEQAQQQAEHEAMVNAISQKIQSATSVEAVLQIAARELGRALDASKAVAQLSAFKRNGDNGNNGNGHHH